MTIPEEEHTHEVVMRFKLPQSKAELYDALHGEEYACLLERLYSECRHMWKYEANASEETVKFAEELGEMIAASGVLDR